MSQKSLKTSTGTQDSIDNTQFGERKTQYLQMYKIKVVNKSENLTDKQKQKNVYLNLKFNDGKDSMVQTQCVDINQGDKFFEIKTRNDLLKIEVLDYEMMKKITKIGLQGVSREFKYTHIQAKYEIAVDIERTHVSLELFKKLNKLNESVFIDAEDKDEKECNSTDDSSSEDSF